MKDPEVRPASFITQLQPPEFSEKKGTQLNQSAVYAALERGR
jgi:hypothetical protein